MSRTAKRTVTNAVAFLVLAVGGVHLQGQEAPDEQECCSPKFNSAQCCGDRCDAGWFTCSAEVD